MSSTVHAPLGAALAHRALDATVTGVVIVDMLAPGRPMTYVNPAFERITGYEPQDALGRNCRMLQSAETEPAAILAMSAALARGEDCQVTLRNVRADGTGFWNEVSLSPVRNAEGSVVQYIGIQNDVTERCAAEARVQHIAFHDGLTGLANRRALQSALDAATERGRGPDDGLALLYVDLDEFKRVNDRLGHAAGDDLLKQVGERASRFLRPGDTLARQGGDEFLVLLDHLGRDAEAVAASVATRLVKALRRPFLVKGTQVQIGASVGVSMCPRDAADGAALLRHADSAMYDAKRARSHGWAFFGGDVEGASATQLDSSEDVARIARHDAELSELLERGKLRAVYQPLMELASESVVGYEALIRGPAGSHLERPDDLFAAARASGRLGELDWACRAAAVQGALEGGLPRSLKLFINAEPEALGVPCPERHRATWARAGELDLVVEITERALTSRPADLLFALEGFRDRGWSIALDDVGADSRSLALIELLRPEVVKLDLRLIQTRPDSDIADVVSAVNAYAERTGAVVLAEGIETAQHLETARSVGATHGQGWRFGRPAALPPDFEPAGRALPRIASSPPPVGLTPHEAVGQVLAVRRATKPLLLEITWQLERQAEALGETAILLSVFQTAERFTRRTRERYAELAERLALVAALGVGMEAAPAGGVRGATLADDDALKDEWSVIVLAPHFAGALVAVDLGDTGPDHLRRFDYAITYDRELVTVAARTLMRRVRPLDGKP